MQDEPTLDEPTLDGWLNHDHLAPPKQYLLDQLQVLPTATIIRKVSSLDKKVSTRANHHSPSVEVQSVCCELLCLF